MPETLCKAEDETMLSRLRQIGFYMSVFCVLGIIFMAAPGVSAQPLALYVSACDVSGAPGEVVAIPIWVDVGQDTLCGYEITLGLNLSWVVSFVIDTLIEAGDTSYVCPFDTAGTLSSGWGLVGVHSPSGTATGALKIIGMAEFLTEASRGIPDYTCGYLLRVYVRIRDDIPDSLSHTVAIRLYDGLCFYSNTEYQLITPVEHVDGSVTACYCGLKGDVNHDLYTDPLDLTLLVAKVYQSQDDLYDYTATCPWENGDVNCSGGAPSPTDISYLVAYVYKSQDFLCERCSE